MLKNKGGVETSPRYSNTKEPECERSMSAIFSLSYVFVALRAWYWGTHNQKP
jgi:hypothetical protein